MNSLKEKSLSLISKMDKKLSNASKFLNKKPALVIQNFAWHFLGYFCFLNVIPHSENTEPIQALIAVTSPIFLSIFLALVTWWYDGAFGTIGATFFKNNPKSYSVLMSFVEVGIMWTTTVTKNWVTAEKDSWGMNLTVVAVYYMLSTMVEIFEINKDRGVLNGSSSVFLLLVMKRFSFLSGVISVPITASIVFYKNLLSSNCCSFCRHEKTRYLADIENARENRREKARKKVELTGGEKGTKEKQIEMTEKEDKNATKEKEPEITEIGDENATQEKEPEITEIKGDINATKDEPEITEKFHHIYSFLMKFIQVFGWMFAFLKPWLVAQTEPQITEIGSENVSTEPEITEIGSKNVSTEPEITEIGNENVSTEPEITEIVYENVKDVLQITEMKDEKDPERTENFPHFVSFLMTLAEVTIVWLFTLTKAWILAQNDSWFWDLIILAVYVIVAGGLEFLRIKKDLGVLNGLASVMVSLLMQQFQFLGGILSIPPTALMVFLKNFLCELYRGRNREPKNEQVKRRKIPRKNAKQRLKKKMQSKF